MKKLFAVALGILTAIGGFVDIGDLVDERAGRVPVRHDAGVGRGRRRRRHLRLRRDERAGGGGERAGDLRPGPRAARPAGRAWPTSLASLFVTFLTFAAEIGGVALALELATSVNYLLWIPSSALLVWLVLWRVQVRGDGERLRAARAGPGRLRRRGVAARPGLGRRCRTRRRTRRARRRGARPTYCYYAIALFGAAMTPYEVFFFSSGGVEERWTAEGPAARCAPTCSSASRSAACCRWRSPRPRRSCSCPPGIQVDTLARSALPVVAGARQDRPRARAPRLLRRHLRRRLRDRAVGRLQRRPVLRLAVGQVRRARCAPPASTPSCCCPCIAAVGVLLTTVDPIKVTEYSIVFSAVALPLTYFPILVVANDRDLHGRPRQRPARQPLGTRLPRRHRGRAVAAIPLMIITKAGQ